MFGIDKRENGDVADVKMISNGYMLTLRGRSANDEWLNREVYAQDFDNMIKFLSEYFNIPTND